MGQIRQHPGDQAMFAFEAIGRGLVAMFGLEGIWEKLEEHLGRTFMRILAYMIGLSAAVAAAQFLWANLIGPIARLLDREMPLQISGDALWAGVMAAVLWLIVRFTLIRQMQKRQVAEMEAIIKEARSAAQDAIAGAREAVRDADKISARARAALGEQGSSGV